LGGSPGGGSPPGPLVYLQQGEKSLLKAILDYIC